MKTNRNRMVQYLIDGNTHYSTTIGNSMYPLLRNRKDRVVIKPIKDSIHLLDVVFYQRPSGVIILHRVVAMTRDYLFICGDNQYRIEKVPKNLIIGKLSSFYRGNNYYEVTSFKYLSYSLFWWITLPIRISILYLKKKLVNMLGKD